MTRLQLKDQVYTNAAHNIACLSKDENTKVGALIVASDGTPVSWGYNGAVKGLPDDEVPHSREQMDLAYVENGELKTFSSNKYPFMEHAECNAIDFGDRDKMAGSTMYVTGFPCNECAKKIAKHRIKRVVVTQMPTDSQSSIAQDTNATKYTFALAGIDLWIGDQQITLGRRETVCQENRSAM